MFLPTLLALFQASFLPGFLAVYGLRLCRGYVRTITCSFCLSALFNFFLVHFFLVFGIYSAPAMYGVVTAELLLLFALLYRRGDLRRMAKGEFGEGDDLPPRSLLPKEAGTGRFLPGVPADPRVFLGVVALAAVAFSLSEVLLRFGDTFSLDDAIESWNRWGAEMARGQWPTSTFLYPQLVPANYSLTYVFSGETSVWIFAKAWVSLFFPVLLLSMYQLYREENRWEIALGVLLTLWLFYTVMTRPFVYGGIVDIALAAFAFNAVFAIYRAGLHREDDACRRELALGALFTVAAALTKQGGLYILVAYPLLVWVLAGAGRESGRRRLVLDFLSKSLRLMVLAVLPWYAVNVYRTKALSGRGVLLETLVVQLHGGRGLMERLAHALGILAGRISPWGLAALATLAAASLPLRRYRSTFLIVTLPYTLLWAAGFSYDHRNIALALPLLAIAAATGFGQICRWVEALGTKIPGMTAWRLGIATVAAACIAVLASLGMYFSDYRLKRYHNNLLIDSVSVSALNHRMDEYFREHPEAGQVLTTYKSMRWVPRLKNRFYPMKIHRFTPLKTYLNLLRKEEVGYLLSDRVKMLPETSEYVESAVSTGELERVFGLEGRFVFYRKIRPPQGEALRAAGFAD